jgi:hypothetical protein
MRRVQERVRGGYQCPHYPTHPRLLQSGKIQSQSTRVFSVKTGMVQAVPAGMDFIVMPNEIVITRDDTYGIRAYHF